MFENIIWPTDGSELADTALPALEALARSRGSKIVALHVVREFRSGRSTGTSVLADEDELKLKIGRQVAALRERGFDVEFFVRAVAHEDAAHAIAALAGEMDADLIVMATHGRGALATALYGSVAKELLHLAPCPVLAIPETVTVEPVRIVPQRASDRYKASQDVVSL